MLSLKSTLLSPFSPKGNRLPSLPGQEQPCGVNPVPHSATAAPCGSTRALQRLFCLLPSCFFLQGPAAQPWRMEGEPVTPDFGNSGKWLEEEPKLRSSVFSFGAGAAGGWQCPAPRWSQERHWADHQILSTVLVFKVVLHLCGTGESPGEL